MVVKDYWPMDRPPTGSVDGRGCSAEAENVKFLKNMQQIVQWYFWHIYACSFHYLHNNWKYSILYEEGEWVAMEKDPYRRVLQQRYLISTYLKTTCTKYVIILSFFHEQICY